MFKIDRAKFMKGPWPGRLIEALALAGVSSLVGLQTAKDYTPGIHPEGKDLNSDTRQERRIATPAPAQPPAAKNPDREKKNADMAAKIREERDVLALKHAESDVKHEHAQKRLGEILEAREKAENPSLIDRATSFFSKKEPVSRAERKVMLENEIKERAKAYADPNSQASIAAASLPKQEGSFWGGALTTAVALVGVSLLVKRLPFVGRRPGRLIHGPVDGVASYNENLESALEDGLRKEMADKARTGAPLSAAEQVAKRADMTKAYENDKIDVGHIFLPRANKVFDQNGHPLPHATKRGRSELASDFNKQAPPAPATEPDKVDMSGLSTAAGDGMAAKPDISEVRSKMKQKGMQHGRS